ncbi:MAG: PfkB family carbohydrate kinase [Pseudomonadota bacterium]
MTARAVDFLCVGAAHWDIVGHAGGPVQIGDDVPGWIEQRPGGVALNVALGLAARGCVVRLSAVVGGDAAGAALIAAIEAAGVGCAPVVRVAEAATSRYLAIEDGAGSLIAAVAHTALLDIHCQAIPDCLGPHLAHTRSLFLEANLSAPVLARLAEDAAAAGVEVVANPVSPAKAPRLRTLLSKRHSPTIIANLEEATAILQIGHRTARDAADGLRRAGAGVALVSDGPRPAALATPSETVVLTPAPLSGRVSVTGAGDALLSAFLACPDRHMAPQAALAKALQAATDHMTRLR